MKKRIERIKSLIDLSEDEVKLLTSFKRISKTELEINGKRYSAWRIVHNDALGPGKGGIRFHPNVCEDEIKSLAFWMSLKNSLIGLPYGGAKGGIAVNPKELNQNEIEEISRAYIRAFHNVLGQDKDIPAPDVYTNPKVMGWMLDEFEKIKQRHEPGMITGKPIELGGCKIRDTATAKGGFIVFNEFLKTIDKKPTETTAAVQGFGNVGMNIATMLHETGLKIVAISDSSGGIYDENGLDILKMKEIKIRGQSVTNIENIKKITNEELLELDVDFLIPAALENQITKDNVNRINARYIFEMANGPVSEDADVILHNKGIMVIPDILANAGGVAASYYEWVQNMSGNIFETNYLENRLERTMIDSFHRVYEFFEKNKESMDVRTAAHIIAIKRILAAEKIRGNLQ